MAKERDQNQCKDCDYAWYPRDNPRSEECPKCKSENIRYAGGAGRVLLILLLLGGGVAAAYFSGLLEFGEEPEVVKSEKVEGLTEEPPRVEEADPPAPVPAKEEESAAKPPESSNSLTELRTWTAKSGKTLKASLLELEMIEGRYVGVFEKPGGETFEYKIGNLSDADVELVKGIVGKK